MGELTLRGVLKEVALDAVGPSAETKDPWGNVKTAVTATGKINRKDFGMTWNKALDNGGVLVSDEVQIELDLELAKKAPAAAATSN